MERGTLLTEKNLKLLVIGICGVFLLQCITDAFNSRDNSLQDNLQNSMVTGDNCNPMEDSYCKQINNNLFPFEVKSNSEWCKSEVEQELNNVIIGLQTEQGFKNLLIGKCEFEKEWLDYAVQSYEDTKFAINYGEPNKDDNELHKCKHGDGEIYRGVKWRCNADGLAQDIPDLQGSTREERMRELLSYYGKEYLYETFFYGGKMFGVYPELAICIAKADTSLGRFNKSQNNLGNVGNNDRGDIVNFDSEYKAVKGIYQTLNNQNLGGYQYVAELSRKFNKTGKIYAGSEDNWHNNVTNCMSVIRGETIDDWFAFRF